MEALTESGKKLSKVIESRTGAVDVGRDEELGVALVAAAERLAAANGKLDKSDDYAKRTAQLANGRLEVLRRLAAPDADDVVWVDTIGRSRRLRIAPVAPGDLIGYRLLDQRPVIAVSATLGGEPPFAAVAFQLGLQPAQRAGWLGRSRRRRAPDLERRPRIRRRCRRRRRSIGRNRASSTSDGTCPTPGASARPGSRRRGSACANS